MAAKKGGESTHADKWDGGKNAQKFTEDVIKNNDAIIENATKAIEKLKKVTKQNPDSTSAIGAGNHSAIMSQLAQHFSAAQQEANTQSNCSLLIAKPFDSLTPDEVEARAICTMNCALLIATPVGQLTNTEIYHRNSCLEVAVHAASEAANTPLPDPFANLVVIDNTANNDFANSQSGLSLTLVAMSNTIDQKAWELNSNLSGNTIIGGNVSIAGVATFGASGNVVMSNTLAVTGNVSFANSLVVTGNVVMSNTLAITGNVSFANTLTVTGNVSFANVLVVTGNVTFNNAVINFTNLPSSDPHVAGQLWLKTVTVNIPGPSTTAITFITVSTG